MARGIKTGGRRAGTPNRSTKQAAELLESLGCNPIEGMVRIAMNERNPPELRGRMFSELARFVYPHRKAVEHTSQGEPTEITVRWMSDADEETRSGKDNVC